MKVKTPLFGFWKILLNVTVDELPLVNELLSPGLVAVILTPPDGMFSIKNVFASESVTVLPLLALEIIIH